MGPNNRLEFALARLTRKSDQRGLLLEVIGRACPHRDDLSRAVSDQALSARQRSELTEILGVELAGHGFNENSEPTAYGIRLEELIDSVNRTVLHRKD